MSMLAEYACALLDVFTVLKQLQTDKGSEGNIIITTNKGRYLNIYPHNFRMVLKARHPEINEKEMLKAFRMLDWIVIPKNYDRNSNTIKYNGKTLRVLTFRKELIETLEELTRFNKNNV